MSDNHPMLVEAAERFFSAKVTPEALLAFERSGLDPTLWTEARALGLSRPGESVDGGEGWQASALVLRAGGRHAAPLPLAEEVVAAQLASAAGISLPHGAVGVGLACKPAEDPGLWSCEAPFGRDLDHILLVGGGRNGVELGLHSCAGALQGSGENVATEPRDSLLLDRHSAMETKVVDLPEDVITTLLAAARTSQMAGALETILALSVAYAREREQFGRKIGKFQAVQQQLAVLAGQVAAAGVAAADAARALDQRGLPAAKFGALEDPSFEIAVAKVVVGEAAEFGPRIAHQVFGAIGFTHEHRLQFFTRRLWAWRAECGSAAIWAERLGGFALAEENGGLWKILTDRSGHTGETMGSRD
jgi:acyl-CoA dehydrogenase